MQNHAVLFKTVSAGVLVFALAACGGQKKPLLRLPLPALLLPHRPLRRAKLYSVPLPASFGDMVRDQVNRRWKSKAIK